MELLSNRLAAAYDRAITAVDDSGQAHPYALWFAGWLARHWAAGPPEPVGPPDAVSVDRRGFLAMRWYTLGQTILGYSEDGPGCYVVPVEELELIG